MEAERQRLGMSVDEFYAIPRDPPSDSKLPIYDADHARNAMARFNQLTGVTAEEKTTARKKIIARAKKFNIDTTRFEAGKNDKSMIERKIFQAKVLDVDSKKGIVTNYDNAFNVVDTDGDISRKGAFAKTLTENVSRAKWFMNHDETKLLGVPFIEGTKEDDFGLLSVNHLNTEKQLGKDMLSDYMLFKDYGRTLEHSIGYSTIKKNPYDLGEGKKGRELIELKLYEKSTLTSWGANEFTPVVDIKSSKNIKAELEMIEQMFTNNYNYSDERKRSAEELFNKLQSLVDYEPGETTHVDEPTDMEILQTILKSFK